MESEPSQEYQGNKPFAPKGAAQSGAVGARKAQHRPGSNDCRERTKQLAVEWLEALRIAPGALHDACSTQGELESIADAINHAQEICDCLNDLIGE